MGRKESQGIKLVKRKDSPYLHIKGTLFNERVRQSTGTSSKEEATLILNDIVSQIKRKYVYGQEDTVVDFNTVAAKHLNESIKVTIKEDARYIEQMASYIGSLPMNEVYRGFDENNKATPLEQFILDRSKDKVSARTINYALGVLNIIGNKAVKRWRGVGGKPLIPSWNCVPLIDEEAAKALGLNPKQEVGPISWEEQTVLFNELPEFNRDMCLFKVNTGCREQEVCKLRWQWLVRWDDDIWYFEIPSEFVKNRLRRVVVLNDIAKSVIQKQVGSHLEFVFVYRGHPVRRLNDSAFKNARARAAKKLPNIKNASIHSLKHTYGARLRVAGVPEEDRNFLTGHKGRMSMTTYYSAPELKQMLEYSNRVCQQNDNLVLLKHRAG
jgi:integrase